MSSFCRLFCGECDKCLDAREEIARLDEIYGSLSEDDANSLHTVDEDDPRPYALNHRGEP